MLIDPVERSPEAFSVLVEQSGNSPATAYRIESWRTMPLEAFKKDVVPNLKESPASGKFFYYVLRDLSENSIYSVLPDGVIEYEVTGLEEVPEKDLTAYLLARKSGNDVRLQPQIINSPLPVWSYAESESAWQLSVKVPETRFLFRHPKLFINEKDYPRIYLPPCIYTVQARKPSNNITWTSIKLLAQDSVAPENCKFAHMPLPNIHSDGQICMGNTRFTDNYNPEGWSKGKVISTAFDLFINTNWNYDLLYDDYFPSNLSEVFEEMYPDLEVPDRVEGDSTLELLWKLLKVLEKEGAWEQLKFIPM